MAFLLRVSYDMRYFFIDFEKGGRELTSVGQIGIDLILNKKPFEKSIGNMQNTANDAGAKIANSFSSMTKKINMAIGAIAVGKIGQAIAKMGKSCIDLGSDLAEVQNVVDVTFKTMSGSVDKWAKSASAQFGLSETMAKKYVGTFGSMAEAFGFSEKQAYNMSTALTGLAGDVASFYNITQDEAYTKLKSVFSGETETLKDLGIVMTQTALDSYALANGYGKTTSAMTEAEKVSLRFAFVQNQLKNATGDFARTQDSWANQTRILQLRFESLKATIGQGLISALNPVLRMINDLLGRVTSLADKFKSFMNDVFGNTSSESTSNSIDKATQSASSLTNEANNSSDAIKNISNSAKKAKKSLAGFDKLNVLTSSSASGTGSSANNSTPSSAVSGKPKTSNKAIDKALNKYRDVVNSIKNTFSKIKDAVSAIGQSWVKIWKNGTGDKILTNIRRMLKHCIDDIGLIAEAFTQAWKKGGLGDEVIQSIMDRVNSLIRLIDVIARDFGKVWSDGTGVRIWTNILKIIRNCNNSVTALRQRITIAWNKNQLGKKIWRDILGIVEDITGWVADMSKIHLDWLENLDLYPIMSAVEKLTGAFRRLLKAVGEKLKTAYKDVLLPLAKWTIEKAVPKLVEALGDALDFVSQVINGMSAGDISAIAGALGAVGTAIVVFKAGRTIASGINKVRGAFSLFFDFINKNPAVAVFLGFASAIGAIVTAVKTYSQLKWSTSEAGKFSQKMDEISSDLEKTKDDIETTLTETMDSLDKVYTDNALIDEYEKKLDELLKKATLTPEEAGQLNTIVKYFKDNVPNFTKVWNNYVQVSKNGTIKLKGNQKTIRGEIRKTIEQYKKLSAQEAISDLATNTTKSKISSKTELNKIESEYYKGAEKIKKQNDKVKKLHAEIVKIEQNDPNYTFNGHYNNLLNQYDNEKGKLYDFTTAFDKVKKQYDKANKSYAKLDLQTTELSKIQGVLNGNYKDASAVLLAYNQGLISLDDVQKNTKKSLGQLKKEAKKSGKNICFGLEEGTKEYSDKLKTTKNQLAESYLKQAKDTLGIHSPSREMKKIGRYTAQGFLIGVNSKNKSISKTMRGMWNRIKAPFASVAEWFGNIFKGAWNAIKKAFTGVGKWFKNLFNGIISFIKAPINFLIDGLNALIKGVNKISFDVPKWVPAIGGKKFGFDIPQIPKLAKGGLVKAPTLAVVGDNVGASTGNPEVVAPLNKLQSIINNNNSTDTATQAEILAYLKRLYELLIVFRNNGGNSYEFIAKLNGKELFEEMVRQNELDKKRHNGKSRLI